MDGQATKGECEAGWLSGPWGPKQPSESLSPLWIANRRFGLRQKGKVRVVDDFSEHGTNAALEYWDKVDLPGLDEVALMAKVLHNVLSNEQYSFKDATGADWSGTRHPGRGPRDTRELLGNTA